MGEAEEAAMVIDYSSHLDKLRKDAAEAALVRDLATNHAKRELFDKLAHHLSRLAEEVERARDALGRQRDCRRHRPLPEPIAAHRIEAARLEEEVRRCAMTAPVRLPGDALGSFSLARTRPARKVPI
jgi:hypothetical protein